MHLDASVTLHECFFGSNCTNKVFVHLDAGLSLHEALSASLCTNKTFVQSGSFNHFARTNRGVVFLEMGGVGPANFNAKGSKIAVVEFGVSEVAKAGKRSPAAKPV